MSQWERRYALTVELQRGAVSPPFRKSLRINWFRCKRQRCDTLLLHLHKLLISQCFLMSMARRVVFEAVDLLRPLARAPKAVPNVAAVGSARE